MKFTTSISGALQPLLAQLNLVTFNTDNRLSVLKVGTWMVSNLCRGKPKPAFALVRPALTTLGWLIFQHKSIQCPLSPQPTHY